MSIYNTKPMKTPTTKKFIIEVTGKQIKVNKFGDKLHSLIDDLGWEYQRMGMSGRETYDEICVWDDSNPKSTESHADK